MELHLSRKENQNMKNKLNFEEVFAMWNKLRNYIECKIYGELENNEPEFDFEYEYANALNEYMKSAVEKEDAIRLLNYQPVGNNQLIDYSINMMEIAENNMHTCNERIAALNKLAGRISPHRTVNQLRRVSTKALGGVS
jgi:hypothetical protein